jgi:branched-chain amino acid aminotransferase
MITTEKIEVRRTTKSTLTEVDFKNLEFGKSVSDHMLVAEYNKGRWAVPEIIPYSHISLSPTSLALHYGQTVFEGMKAFRMKDGSISIFRMKKHYQRLCKSLERMCMPLIPYVLFSEGVKQLVQADSLWVSGQEGSALYIRPFVFASNEERFGMHESEEYKFVIFTGPVGPYYSKPIRVWVEDKFIRAAAGGTGYAKCGGNYGGAFYPTKLAKQQGFDQVLWTDGSPELYIEESGTMNVMFVINNILITPPLSDTILDGITRDSYLILAKELGYATEERRISINELILAFEIKTITEAFGTGTAAVAAPIQSISIKGKEFQLPSLSATGFISRARKLLDDIRTGNVSDNYSWNTVIKSC